MVPRLLSLTQQILLCFFSSWPDPVLEFESGPTDKAEMDKPLWCSHPGPPGTVYQLSSPGAFGHLACAEGGLGCSDIDAIPSCRGTIFGVTCTPQTGFRQAAGAGPRRLPGESPNTLSVSISVVCLLLGWPSWGRIFPNILPLGSFDQVLFQLEIGPAKFTTPLPVPSHLRGPSLINRATSMG